MRFSRGKCDGEPRAQSIRIGLQRLDGISATWQIFTNATQSVCPAEDLLGKGEPLSATITIDNLESCSEAYTVAGLGECSIGVLAACIAVSNGVFAQPLGQQQRLWAWGDANRVQPHGRRQDIGRRPGNPQHSVRGLANAVPLRTEFRRN